jgi:hypothetical protein
MTQALYFQYILAFPNTYRSFFITDWAWHTRSHLQSHVYAKENHDQNMCNLYALFNETFNNSDAESKWCEDNKYWAGKGPDITLEGLSTITNMCWDKQSPTEIWTLDLKEMIIPRMKSHYTCVSLMRKVQVATVTNACLCTTRITPPLLVTGQCNGTAAANWHARLGTGEWREHKQVRADTWVKVSHRRNAGKKWAESATQEPYTAT